MQRRTLLKSLLGLPLSLTLSPAWANSVMSPNRVLVLVEFQGGNDGLNAVIPYQDPRYYQARPRLGIPRDKVIQLSDTIGLHPALQAVHNIWENRQLAIIQGVGYAAPNLSHFRSIEIWQTGSDSDRYLQQGWLSQLFQDSSVNNPAIADGIVLGSDIGPLSGERTRAIVMARPEQFIKRARRLQPAHQDSNNPALQHILKVETDISRAASGLETYLAGDDALRQRFPKNRIAQQFAVAAQLITRGVRCPVYHLSHGSFDTHTDQANTQQRLLEQLAEALARFKTELSKANRWDDVIVMTYSEFGRRVKENGNRGTDHGTAAAHFMLGGRVKGGLYGPEPNLADLDGGNLRYAIDYRQLYSSVIEHWWQLPQPLNPFRAHRGLQLIT